MTADEIIDVYPSVKVDDVHESLRFAAWLAEENVLPVQVMPAARDPHQ